MSGYKITERVIGLVEQLFAEGYEGEATLSFSYCSGTANIIGSAMSVQLTGFCKETLHLVEDSDGQIVFVGRYNEERRMPEATVADIVAVAWSMYRTYKASKYSRPSEFASLFEKHGYLTKQTRVVEELIEKDNP